MLSIQNLAISLFPLTALSANWHTSHVRLTKYRMFESSLFRIDYFLFCRTYDCWYQLLLQEFLGQRSARCSKIMQKALVLSFTCSQAQIQPTYEQRKMLGKYTGMQKSL